jgi:hypothetical protein
MYIECRAVQGLFEVLLEPSPSSKLDVRNGAAFNRDVYFKGNALRRLSAADITPSNSDGPPTPTTLPRYVGRLELSDAADADADAAADAAAAAAAVVLARPSFPTYPPPHLLSL